MAAQRLRVAFTIRAWADLDEVAEYWAERGEAARGRKYARDLPSAAIRELSDPRNARAGRFLADELYSHIQEIRVFKRSYRILYVLKEEEGVVQVLRFWHSHRDEPFRD
jgi:plasmid stabilization system protein ParE